jgi:hypothetical protein
MAKFESTNFDAAALANGRYLPLESPMPGTTIGIIPLQAFASGGTLYGGWAQQLMCRRACDSLSLLLVWILPVHVVPMNLCSSF